MSAPKIGQWDKLTNLESISTIRALQHAYANPDEYTVYTITKDTAYQLDLVDLPTRTKEMMRADIEAGNTVITPNKKVRIFSWEDSVYLSYNFLTGEGRYVLGEGVLNGGDTPCATDIKKALFDPRLPDEVPICLANGKDSVRVSYKVEKDANGKISFVGFVFTSQANGQQKIGNITDSNLDNWLLEVQKYKEATGSENCPEFGYPVRDKIDYNYGRYQHTAWEFSNGFKAFSPDVRGQGFTPLFSNYNTIINKTKAEQSFKSLGFLSGSKKLEFSPSIGTYKAFQGGLKTAYLVPKSTGTTTDYSKVVTIENELLSRADTEISSQLVTKIDLESGKNNLFTTYYENGLGSTYCRSKFLSDANCRKLISLLGFPIENLSSPIRVSTTTEQISTVNQDMQRQHHIGGTSFIHVSTRDFGGGSVTPISTVYRHSLAGIRDLYFDQGSLSLSHPLRFPFGDTTIAAPGVIRQNFASNQAVLYTMSSGNTRITEADELRKSGYSCDVQPIVSDFELLKAFVDGVTDTGVSELEGAANLILDPIGTIVGIKNLLLHPILAIEGVSQLLIDQYNSAACQGRRSYLAGQITAYAGSAILGAKGATKITEAIKLTRAGVWIERVSELAKVAKKTISTKVAKTASFFKTSTQHWQDLLDKRLASLIQNAELNQALDQIKIRELLDQAAGDIEEQFIRTARIERTTLSGFVKEGPFTGELKWRYDPKYDTKLFDGVPESTLYKQPGKFDSTKMIEEGITKDGFYKINDITNELNSVFEKYDELVKKFDDVEIIFVKKLNGDVIMSPRRRSLPGGGFDKLPHPYLSEGEDVLTAGTIRPGIAPNEVIINNATGHYQVHEDSLKFLKDDLNRLSLSVIIEPR